MRRALSSSQMALPGTLPCSHTRTCANMQYIHRYTITHRHAHIHTYARAHTRNHISPCRTPNCCWLSVPLTPLASLLHCFLWFSILPLFPPSPHLWQLLIHVAALQMSQLTSWENSREEKRGEDLRGEEEFAASLYLIEEQTTGWKIYRSIHD